MTKLDSNELREFGEVAHFLTYAAPCVDGWHIESVCYRSHEGGEVILTADENGEMAVVVTDR